MKYIKLGGRRVGSKTGIAIIDDRDFKWINSYRWNIDKDGYAIRFECTKNTQRRILMSREIMKCPVGEYIDHINGNKLDNRRHNLRICSRTENNQNIGKRRHNTTGFKSVYLDKRNSKFEAYIGISKKHVHLDYFRTARDAAKRYDMAAIKNYGAFAKLNKLTNNHEKN